MNKCLEFILFGVTLYMFRTDIGASSWFYFRNIWQCTALWTSDLHL